MRKPVNNKTLQYMLKRPAAYARYMATGQAPTLANPSSPLITLLKSLGPRDLSRITGVTIGYELGYSGHRIFATANQALGWLAPSHAAAHYPSQTWQDKRFQKPLTIDDLAGHASVPADIIDNWWRRHQSLPRPSNNPMPGGDQYPGGQTPGP
jgi:hypothetical protein